MADNQKKSKGISVSKKENFSDWYSEVVLKAELADLRYNIKGFVCYMPWAVTSIKRMYTKYETLLEKNGHLPLIMPSLIPESNFKLEADHVEGFTPQVFWVTEAGNDNKFEERLALRPTSETALYKMYSMWIRSYNDLPFKRYQSCQVWRYEGKMTRPFLRAREFHWIEAHNVFETEAEARTQVKEDMDMTYQMIRDEFCIPMIFFQRPEWDKFPGAVHTYAADALMDDGKVLQLPSTHLLGTHFSKVFGVNFTDREGKEQLGHITCYGPAISRIYGAMIARLGDDQGMILPFDLAPVQIVIVPIIFKDQKEAVVAKAKEIEAMFNSRFIVKLDDREGVSAGEKYNEWEMKGVPIRIEIGPKDMEKGQAVVVNRQDQKKEFIKLIELKHHVEHIADTYTKHLKEKHLKDFEDYVVACNSMDEVKQVIENNKIACVGFCSIDKDGYNCAAEIEKTVTGATVRGKKVDHEKHKFEKCMVCGKDANDTVYVARSY